MRKALPEKMFSDPEQQAHRPAFMGAGPASHRDRDERAAVLEFRQPPASRREALGDVLGQALRVPNMPETAQKCLGIDDKWLPGTI